MENSKMYANTIQVKQEGCIILKYFQVFPTAIRNENNFCVSKKN